MHPRLPSVLAWASTLIVPSLGIAGPASAATCAYDVPTRIVTIVTQGPETVLEAIGGNIVVNTATCPLATVMNTDKVNILGTSSSELVAISVGAGAFAPGATDEGDGTSEIEFTVDLFTGSEDVLAIAGSFGNDTLTTGTSGINLNDDFDPDVTAGGLEFLQLIGLSGNDTLSAAGGRGTGEPDLGTQLYGDAGWDLLTGGSVGDYLAGGAGKDRLRGGPGADELIGDEGNDSLVGGAGDDRLVGNQGRDVLRGGSGKDRLNGGIGTDNCYPGSGGGKSFSCEKGATGAPSESLEPVQSCQGYSPCLSPGPDVDCAGGSGNGPRYVEGPVTVTGSDPYGLDADGDGTGCESGGGGGGEGGGGSGGGGGGGGGDCTPGYSPCIPPGPDVDCAGGSGNGPRYVDGPVTVTGSDPYGLDADGDGLGCE